MKASPLMALFACSPLVMAAGAQDQPVVGQQENAVEEYTGGTQPGCGSRYIFNRHFQCLRHRSRTHDLRRFERAETYRRISGLGQRLHQVLYLDLRVDLRRIAPRGAVARSIRRDHWRTRRRKSRPLGEHPGRLPRLPRCCQFFHRGRRLRRFSFPSLQQPAATCCSASPCPTPCWRSLFAAVVVAKRRGAGLHWRLLGCSRTGAPAPPSLSARRWRRGPPCGKSPSGCGAP